eukprot:672375-Amphidinium_carterae.1
MHLFGTFCPTFVRVVLELRGGGGGTIVGPYRDSCISEASFPPLSSSSSVGGGSKRWASP